MDDIAIARAINLSDFIAQDSRSHTDSILLAQIASAREEAIEATRQLLTVDPYATQEIMTLQNEVKRFAELIVWIQNAHQNARDAYALLPETEQAEVLALLTQPQTTVNDA
jgi:hypothetical protein